jgi:hypothetical protein
MLPRGVARSADELSFWRIAGSFAEFISSLRPLDDAGTSTSTSP